MASYKFLVFTNPKPGRDDDYNAWYTNYHAQEVLAVPGYVRAQRFALEAGQSASTEWKYLIIYEVETDDVGATRAALEQHFQDGHVKMDDSMAKERVSYMFRPITGIIEPR